MGEGEYIVLVGGELQTFTHWDDIPQQFDNLIKFLPVIPDGPHTHEQHVAIDGLPDKFREILGREHARSNKNR